MTKENYIYNQEQAILRRQDTEKFRDDLLRDAKTNGVSVVHVFDKEHPYGGLTIAFRKVKPNQVSTNMVNCAIVTCAYQDTFNRKLGTELALRKWFDGETVDLPLSSGHADEDLNGIVKRKFMALFFTE